MSGWWVEGYVVASGSEQQCGRKACAISAGLGERSPLWVARGFIPASHRVELEERRLGHEDAAGQSDHPHNVLLEKVHLGPSLGVPHLYQPLYHQVHE